MDNDRKITRTRRVANRSYPRPKDRIIKGVEQAFNEQMGLEIDTEEIVREFEEVNRLRDIASQDVKKPSFPFVMIYFSLVLDILDLADFTGVGWFIVSIIEIVFTVILFFYFRKKISFTFKVGSKFIFKKMIPRLLIGTAIANIIPFVGIFATFTFFVIVAHNRHSKLAKNYMLFVEQVSKIVKDHDDR